jgi:hypothetical protein
MKGILLWLDYVFMVIMGMNAPMVGGSRLGPLVLITDEPGFSRARGMAIKD